MARGDRKSERIRRSTASRLKAKEEEVASEAAAYHKRGITCV